MKLQLKLLGIIFLLLVLSHSSIAIIATPSTVLEKEIEKPKKAKNESDFNQLINEGIPSTSKANKESIVKRKMNLNEKFILKMIQKRTKKIRKNNKRPRHKNLYGILSLIFAGISIFIPFVAILTLIVGLAMGIKGLKRKEPNRKLSIWGIALNGGAILFGIGALIAVAVIIKNNG